MDPLNSDQWKRLREIVRDESREAALTWLRKNVFLPKDVALSCVQIAEDQVLMEA